MLQHYGSRSINASPFVALRATVPGLGGRFHSAIEHDVFSRESFLAAVLAKAGSKAAIARALNQPSSRVAELYNKDNPRRLTMEDGMRLAEAFDLPLDQRVSAERLKPILEVCLRYAPKSGWSDQDVQRLAQEIEYGLELLRAVAPSPVSEDALDVAARAIAARFRDKPA